MKALALVTHVPPWAGIRVGLTREPRSLTECHPLT